MDDRLSGQVNCIQGPRSSDRGNLKCSSQRLPAINAVAFTDLFSTPLMSPSWKLTSKNPVMGSQRGMCRLSRKPRMHLGHGNDRVFQQFCQRNVLCCTVAALVSGTFVDPNDNDIVESCLNISPNVCVRI